ncbi:MAG TPA: glycosyltransferase family 61 protein [Candidatus Dormibacteraeota bacterium]
MNAYGGLRRSNTRIVPLQWLHLGEHGERLLLEPAADATSFGPRVGRQSADEERVRIPAVCAWHLRDARISSASSSALVRYGVVAEGVPGQETRIDVTAGHLRGHGRKVAMVEVDEGADLEGGIFLGGNGSYNFYHWMCELLPKLQYLDEVDRRFSRLPLLVDRKAVEDPGFAAGLKLLAGERETIPIPADPLTRVRDLVYINSPNPATFNLKPGTKSRPGDAMVRRSSIDYWRAKAAGWRRDDAAESSPKRIFVARRENTMRTYNQVDVEAVLSERGFATVFMEGLSLPEQVRLFANADVIAGPMGAAWAHLMFVHAGVKCVSWMPAYGGATGFATLARAAGADLRYVLHDTAARSTAEMNELSYAVDPSAVARAADDLLAD